MGRGRYYRYPLDRPCVRCGARIADEARRDKGYCSDACRQAAYRERRKTRAPLARMAGAGSVASNGSR